MKLKCQSDKTLYLSTPEQEIAVTAHIEYYAQDNQLSEDDASSMAVTIEYNDKTITGYGIDYPWMDAFIHLQKQSPSNIVIKGCINCRHGNMCPCGNFPFEVFCTKDVIITKASDLWSYTEVQEEALKRSREYTQVCEDYEKQSKKYYTYTDYRDE